MENKIDTNKIINNIMWLIMDKFLILFLQFFVGIKIVNHYGTEIYGEYSYAIAIVAFSPILLEIINGRIIKKFYDENFNKTVSVVTTFKNLLSIFIFIAVICLYPFLKEKMMLYIMLLLLTFDNILLTMTIGIENYFEYKLLSKKIVILNNIIKIISYMLQYIGLIYGFSILIIPIVRICGNFLRVILFKQKYYKIFKKRIEYIIDKKIIKKLIKDSYYLWISIIAFILYTQIDKIMIGNMLGVSEVGVYSIAIQLSGLLAILIGPFQNSIYPKLIELYQDNNRNYIKFYLKVNTIFTQLYLLLSIISIIIVKYSFPYIYSKEYNGAIECYIILVVSIFFKANGALQTGHMVLKKITKRSFIKTFFGLLLNIVLNVILIPKYGIKGAAIATSITQICTLFIMDYFIKDFREQFFIQLKSFNPLNMRG